jgi:hypothetical protein
MIVVNAQAVKNESKQESIHPYVSIARGIKSLPSVHSTYDRVFSWTTIIATCVVVVNVCYTISMWIESTMTTSIKVWKSSLVIRISIRRWVWWKKRWEISLWTCAPLSKTIMKQNPKMYCGLSYAHSHKGTKTNGYVDCQWYDHTYTVKDGQL